MIGEAAGFALDFYYLKSSCEITFFLELMFLFFDNESWALPAEWGYNFLLGLTVFDMLSTLFPIWSSEWVEEASAAKFFWLFEVYYFFWARYWFFSQNFKCFGSDYWKNFLPQMGQADND